MVDLSTDTRNKLIDHQQRRLDYQKRKPEEFESAFQGIADLLTISEKKCEKHGCHYQEFSGRSVCPFCQREKLEREEIERVKEAESRYQKRITYDRLEKDSVLSDRTLLQATFDSFIPDDDESIATKKMARHLAGKYLKGETFNTLLTGNAGTGKTHLAMAMIKAVNEHANPRKSCLFLSLSDFILEIRNTFGNNDRNNHDTEQTMVERVANVDLLVIDDLGAETGFIGTEKKATDFTQRVLYNLMNKRQDKSTIVTTNLNSEQVTDMYDSKVISRLYRKLEGNVIEFKSENDKRMTF